jgi:hypothetical protein
VECAHDICTCLVEERGGYCSEACGMMSDGAALCPCGHAECRASSLVSGGDEL